MLRGSKIPYFKTRKPNPNPTKITQTRQEPEGINQSLTQTRPEPDFCYPNPSLGRIYKMLTGMYNAKSIKIHIMIYVYFQDACTQEFIMDIINIIWRKILFTFNLRKFLSMIGWISAAIMIKISFSLPKFQFFSIIVKSIVCHFSIDFSKIFSP